MFSICSWVQASGHVYTDIQRVSKTFGSIYFALRDYYLSVVHRWLVWLVSAIVSTSTDLEYVTAGCYWLTDRPGDGSWPMGAMHCPLADHRDWSLWSLLVSGGGPGQWWPVVSARGRGIRWPLTTASNHQLGEFGNWAAHYHVASWQWMVLSFCHWFSKLINGIVF